MSAALDCVGGEATSAVTASLLPGGSTIIYGALGGPVLQMNILDVFLGKSLKVCSDMPCLHVALMDLSYMRCNSNEHLLTMQLDRRVGVLNNTLLSTVVYIT